MLHCFNGKGVSITYYECVGKLCHPGIQNACVILSCDLPGCTIFFHIISQTALFSEKNLQLLSETFLVIRRRERDMIKNLYCSSCEAPVILV